MLAATDPKHSGGKKICFEWSKMNSSRVMRSRHTRFRGLPWPRSYVNNVWWLVQIGRLIEYACGVISQTIKLDWIVPWRCAWTSFVSKEILSCILQVSLEYVSCVSAYNTTTRSRWDSLSIPGWLEIYCTGTVSGESRSWPRFSCAIDCQLFNIDDSVNIPNSIATLVSGAPKIDKQEIIGIKLGGLSAPESTYIVHRFRYLHSTRTI